MLMPSLRRPLGLGRDIPATLARSTRFRTFTTILVATQLIDDLREPRPWIVLAPTDDAFAALPPGLLDALFAPGGVEQLIDLAELHVGCAAPPQLGECVASLLGLPLPLALANGENVVLSPCDNGVVGVVHHVSLPPSLRSTRADARQNGRLFPSSEGARPAE
jgi:hypothetical protein